MHEFSIMSELVNVLKAEIASRKIIKLNEVILEVGELAFLAPAQLKFSYGVLVESDDVMKDSVLTINEIRASVVCDSCEYKGPIDYVESEQNHLQLPIIKCPECSGSVNIIEGKDCQIKNIIAEIADVEEKL